VQFAFFFNLDGDPGCDPADTQTGHSQGLAALANVTAHEISEARSDPANPGEFSPRQQTRRQAQHRHLDPLCPRRLAAELAPASGEVCLRAESDATDTDPADRQGISPQITADRSRAGGSARTPQDAPTTRIAALSA
jgi:hypothetical protein